jgi:hypothetical protein
MKTLRRGCWPLDAQSGLSWIVRANDAPTTTAPPWWPAGTTSTVVRRPRSTAPELKRRHRTHLAQDPDTSKRRDLSDEEDRAQRRERSLWHPHGLHGAAVLVLLRVQRLALHLLRGQRPRLVRDDAADAGTLPHPRPPQVDIENGIRSTVPFLSRRPSTVIAACTSFARSEESRWSTWPHRQAFGCSAGGSS